MISCVLTVKQLLQALLHPSSRFQQVYEICCVFHDIGIFPIFLAVGLYHCHQTSQLYDSMITSH